MEVLPGPLPDGRRSGGDEGLGSRLVQMLIDWRSVAVQVLTWKQHVAPCQSYIVVYDQCAIILVSLSSGTTRRSILSVCHTIQATKGNELLGLNVFAGWIGSNAVASPLIAQRSAVLPHAVLHNTNIDLLCELCEIFMSLVSLVLLKLKVHCHAIQCFFVDFLRSKMAARRLKAAAPTNEKQVFAGFCSSTDRSSAVLVRRSFKTRDLSGAFV